MQSSATVTVNQDGSAVVRTGNPDIGGSRASMQMMAAEALEIDPTMIAPTISDTNSLGFNFLTAGSRTTFAVGKATHDAGRKVVQELRPWLCMKSCVICRADAACTMPRMHRGPRCC